VLGGCCHDYEKQKDILTKGISERANVSWTIAYDPDKGTKHKNPVYDNPEWYKGFDVVVHDECESDVKDTGVIERILKPHKEGLPAVFRRHERLARATRSGAEALGLELFARSAPSPALTAVVAPRGLDSEAVLSTYSTSHNITIAGGQGEMKGKVFRLGHMGYVAEFDVITALAALEQVLHELGQPVDFGAGVRAAQKVLAQG